MVNTMELYQLKSFLEILQTQNLTRAAGNLHISQSALSSQIRLLEDELGLSLFDRSSRGMYPTESGRLLHSYAGEVLDAAERLKEKALQMSGKRHETCKIGLNTDGSFLRVSKLSRALTATHPTTNFIFVSSQTIHTPEMLRQGIIDLGFFFGARNDSTIVSETLSFFDIRIVIPSAILPPNSSLTWQQAATLPWIWSVSDCPFYQIVQGQMDSLGLEPRKVVDAMDESVVKELVMDSQGLAILREDEARSVAAQGTVWIWENVHFTLPLQLGKLKSITENPLLDAIAHDIRQVWERETVQVI